MSVECIRCTAERWPTKQLQNLPTQKERGLERENILPVAAFISPILGATWATSPCIEIIYAEEKCSPVCTLPRRGPMEKTLNGG